MKNQFTHEVTLHLELVDRGRVVHPDLLLLGIVPDPHAHVIAAPLAPDVVGHLKPDDQDAQVKLLRSFPQSVGPQEFIQAALLRVVIRGVVLVLALAFAHFEEVFLTFFVEIRHQIF